MRQICPSCSSQVWPELRIGIAVGITQPLSTGREATCLASTLILAITNSGLGKTAVLMRCIT